MIEELSESARLVISHAGRLAAQAGDRHIGVEHLFIAAVALDEVDARRALTESGVDTDSLLRDLEIEMERFAVGSGGDALLTPRARRCLQDARRLAGDRGEATALHVLIAVLDDPLALPTRMIEARRGDVPHAAIALSLAAARRTEVHRPRGRLDLHEPPRDGSLLATLGRDLTQDARDGRLHAAIGRKAELRELMTVLLEKGRKSALLLGDAGVGKTALVEGLAVLIANGRAHPDLLAKRIHTIEVGSLVAGTGVVGKLQEKLQALVKLAAEDPDLIVFIDEIHMLVGAGATSTSPALDAANILKPALSSGDLQCIGATTLLEYRSSLEDDPALARRFSPIRVDEPAPSDTLEILVSLRPQYEAFHHLQIDDGALRAAVDLSVLHLGDRRLPAKAIDVLNRACTDKRLRSWLGDCGELGELSREEQAALLTGAPQPAAATPSVLTKDDVAQVVSAWAGTPVGPLGSTESERLLELEALLGKRIRGQAEAVSVVARTIRTARSGLGDPTRPLGSFLFLGPPGVGKTALGKGLAEVLFGDRDKIVTVDMTEYQSEADIWKLIGSSAGHVDSARGGRLTEDVKKDPYSVVLFDEIEKAHPGVLDLLLTVLDDGRLTDGLGREVDFRSTVVIFTSAVGSQLPERPFGFPSAQEGDRDPEKRRRAALREAEEHLGPELFDRLDEVVCFDPLTKDALRDIAAVMVERLPVRVQIDDAVAAQLVESSYNPAWGARPLRRAIRELIVEPLAAERLRGAIDLDRPLVARVVDGRIVFAAAGEAAQSAGREGGT